MNIALDRLQYLSNAAPLEKQLTFRELQDRPLEMLDCVCIVSCDCPDAKRSLI